MKKFTLLLFTLMAMAMNVSATNKEHVVFLGEHVIGNWDWDTRMEIDGNAFSDLATGDFITVQMTKDTDAGKAAGQEWYQYNISIAIGDPYPVIGSGDMNAQTEEITIAPTDEEIAQIKANKLVINGHFVKINKIMYGKSNQTSIVTDASQLPFSTGEWDGPVLDFDLETLKTAKVGDKIVLDINSTFTTDERNYCQVFIYFGEPYIGRSDLKDQTTAEFVLTEETIAAIADAPDAKLYGKGVVLNNVYLISHEYIYTLNAEVSLPAELDGVTADVNLYRKFDWEGTICLPFDVADLSAFPEGVKVYEFKEYTTGLVFVERDHIEAGVPYYMKRPYDPNISEDEKYQTVTFEGVTISTTLNDSETSNGLTFKGNYTAGMDMEGKYGMAWNNDESQWGFYKGGTNSKLNAYGAYFEGSVAAARLDVIIDEDPTSIREINNIEARDNSCYDLQGRRVAQPTKGIYIVNGKKTILK